ncbi:lysine permease [Hanseniaspora osmophila]
MSNNQDRVSTRGMEALSSGYESYEMKSNTFDENVKQLSSKQDYFSSSVGDEEENIEGTVSEGKVQRGLKARHMSMIALGGTIGTGLFIGISQPLANAGPVSALVAYIWMSSIVYFICQSLGEMATYIPVSSSLTVFPHRFLSPAFGWANSILYWWNWAITYAIELSVIPQIINYWSDVVPLWGWILMFWVIVTAANFAKVSIYGEVEFILSSIKVVAIVGYLIFAICIVLGAGNEGRVGFRYWKNPGVAAGIISKDPSTARFLGFVSSWVNAAFSFQGCEMVGVVAGEAKSRSSISKAFNKVFYRLVIFYIGSIFFVGMLVPYNDPRLSSDSSSAVIASSPFVISIERAGVKVLPSIFNAIVLITLISAANSDLMIGSRVLLSIAKNGNAPQILARCNKDGVPVFSVFITALFGLLAFLVVNNNANQALEWLINISSLAGCIQWFFISICHIRFIAALKYRGISRDELPFKSKGGIYGAYYSAAFLTLIIFIQGFQAFTPKFNVSDFFAAYISLIFFAVAYIGAQIYYKCKFMWAVEQIDIDSDRREIDATIWEEDKVPKNLWEKFWNQVA